MNTSLFDGYVLGMLRKQVLDARYHCCLGPHSFCSFGSSKPPASGLCFFKWPRFENDSSGLSLAYDPHKVPSQMEREYNLATVHQSFAYVSSDSASLAQLRQPVTCFLQ